MRVTAKDVAKHAGVSVATVSYVINDGPRPVTEETRQKVQQAIAELGYKPNRLARGLTTGKTNTLGIIIPDISDLFFPKLILGAESVARDRGYNVFLCNANRDPEMELQYVDLLTERQADGLMIVGSRLDQDGLTKAIKNHNAVILTPFTIPDAITFSIDDFDGGRQIGEHLFALGHKSIRYLEGTWTGSSANRYRGLVSALQTAGIPSDNVIAEAAPTISVEAGRELTLEIYNQDPQMTALVCYNDSLALGALKACIDKGIRVPEDLSVVGFDDISEANRACVPLTTVHVDRYELGATMMAKLIDLIEEKDESKAHIVIPVNLVTRDSSAAPG